MLMVSSALANATSTDVSGVSIRLDSAVFPIPAGFVLESVNVREIGSQEVEELRFISKREDPPLRSIDVYRLRSLHQSTGFQLESLLHFGDQAMMKECSYGPFVVLRADYQDLPAYTKVAIVEDGYQILLIGQRSPSAAVSILRGIEKSKADREPIESLEQLAVCLSEAD
jgi:hypothetical protein